MYDENNKFKFEFIIVDAEFTVLYVTIFTKTLQDEYFERFMELNYYARNNIVRRIRRKNVIPRTGEIPKNYKKNFYFKNVYIIWVYGKYELTLKVDDWI